MSPEFLQKDSQILYNFFNLDRTGKCMEKEFLSQFSKGERLMALLNQRIEGGVATLNTRGMDNFGTINDREEMARS